MLDKLKDIFGGNILQNVAASLGGELVKKKIIRFTLIAAVCGVVVGGISGWFTREIFIRTPEGLEESRPKYEDTIDQLQEESESYRNASDFHQKRAEDLLAELESRKPDEVENPNVIKVASLMRKDNNSSYERGRVDGANQMRNLMIGHSQKLQAQIIDYQNRELQWSEAVDQYRESVTSLQNSLDAAVKRADLAEDRVNAYRKVSWADTISAGPQVTLPVYPAVGSPSIGVGITLDVRSLVGLIRG